MYDNDMYRTFKDRKVRYNSIFTFKKQNKDYLVPFNRANFVWCYSDSFSLTFNIDDPDSELDNLPEDTIAHITFYDFRFENLYELEQQWKNPVIVDIDKETSLLFKRGIYYCSIILKYDEKNITVIPSENCIIEVI